MDPGELRKPIPPPRRGVPPEAVVLSAMALATLAGFIALGTWQDLAAEHRARLVFGISLVLIGGVASLLCLGPLRRRMRERLWQRAMAEWQASSNSRRKPRFLVAQMPRGDLEQLAIQTYHQLGYLAVARRDEDPYVQLINPSGHVELLACRHEAEPVELHHINSFYLEVMRAKAVRGFYWASAGFTEEAWKWAARRPIVLADRDEIGRFLEAAHIRGPIHSVF